MKYSLFKKIAFFWFIVHLAAYLSFKLQWSPSFKYTEGKETTINYILTPKYQDYKNGGYVLFSSSYNDCPYAEHLNFYPFHKFTYWWGNYEKATKGFVGIFGYYGNDEFIVYFIIPFAIWILILLYRKLFNNK